MDDEDECVELGEFEVDVWNRRLMPIGFAVLGLNFLRGVADAVSETLTAAQGLVAAHANFQCSQNEFREEAALEIETLISGDES